MKKPTNRKERIEFLIKKDGLKMTESLVSFTDSEVKSFFEMRWNAIKNKNDYIEEPPICIRCENEVLWHSECGCGEDRAVFDKEGWLDDIENNFNDTGWLKDVNDQFIRDYK